MKPTVTHFNHHLHVYPLLFTVQFLHQENSEATLILTDSVEICGYWISQVVQNQLEPLWKGLSQEYYGKERQMGSLRKDF